MKTFIRYSLFAVALTLLGGSAFAQPNISYSTPTVLTLGTAFTLSPTNTGGVVTPFAFGTGTLLSAAVLKNNPYGMAIDPSGNIYVANYGANTISKYNSTGTYQGTFGTGGTIAYPAGLSFDASGIGYVLNYNKTNKGNGNANSNAYIDQYSLSGVYGSTIVQGLGTANGIAIDASSNLYVTEGSSNAGNNTASQYNTSGALAFSIATGHTVNPVAVAADALSNIYVLDNTNKNVTKYSSIGTYLSTIITGLSNPNAICIDGAGNIYVGDSGTGGTPGSVKVYNAAGTLTSITGLTDPRGLVTDKNENLYVSDYTKGTVNKYQPVGGYILSGILPAGLIFDNITGTFSGTPTTSFNATTYTVTAYNAGGSSIATVTLSCPPTNAPGISYSPSSINVFTINTAITPLVPAITGAPSITVYPAMPAGLSIDPSTGTISGTPTATQVATGYTVTAVNNSGSTSVNISIACVIDDYYTGKGGGDWSNKASWSTRVVPSGSNYRASIGVIGYSGAAPTITTADGSVNVDYLTFGAAHAGNLTVQTGASLTINTGLTVNNNAAPTLTGVGTGAINIAPAALVTITGTGALTINNSASSLNSNFVTLQSDATGSATVSQITTGSITGPVSVQRFITGGVGYRGYRLLSSPVYATNVSSNNVYSINYITNSCYTTGTTGISGGFDKTGNPTLYLFRENIASSNASFTGGNFRAINNLNTSPNYSMDIDGGPFTIPIGNGFLFFFRGDKSAASLSAETSPSYIPTSTTLTASGTLNQGFITVKNWFTNSSNLLFTNTPGNSSVQGYNLIGNPYASSIDWDTYNTSTPGTGIYAPNVGNSIYIIDPVSKNYGVYMANSGIPGTNNLTHIIPSGQGFFVVAQSTGASLTFNENAKTTVQVTGPNLLLGKPVANDVIQYLHLKLNQKLSQDSVQADEIYIRFNNSANSNFLINEDVAQKPGFGIASLASMSSDGVPLSINSLKLPQQSASIALNVNAVTDGAYQLSMPDVKSIPALFDIWLVDAYKKDSIDIRNNPAYSFDIIKSDSASYGSGRFSLVIRQNPAKGVHLLSFTASKVPGGSQVAWETENEQNYTYFTVERSTDGGTTFDVLGSVTSSALGTYSFLDKYPVKGTDKYRLKIEDLNSTITYSQVVSLDYGSLGNSNISNIVIYPNPVSNTINLSITQNSNLSPKLLYNIKIINITGTVVKNGNTKTTAWQENASNLTPGTYVVQVINSNDNSLVGKATFIKL